MDINKIRESVMKEMDINKIRDAMKVLKEECKKCKECKDCVFYDAEGDFLKCHLAKDPARWEEDKIIENNCTTAHIEDIDEWYAPVLRCDNCLKINNMDELEKFAEFAEKMIRNKILTVDEVRDILGYEENEKKFCTVTEFADHCRECGAKRHYELGKLNTLNTIKEEIKNCIVHSPYFNTTKACCCVRDDVMQIFDKHITKIEEEENA